jgi:hypothetical protein
LDDHRPFVPQSNAPFAAERPAGGSIEKTALAPAEFYPSRNN